MLVLIGLVARQMFSGPARAGAAGPIVEVPAVVNAPEAATGTTDAADQPFVSVADPLPPTRRAPSRDPFSVDWTLFRPLEVPIDPPDDVAPPSIALDPVAEAIGRLRLQSTVTGPERIATVNGIVVRVGDRVRGFDVRQIGVRFVVLAYGDRRFVLTMDQPAGSPRRRDVLYGGAEAGG
ncbi:MAG: hypothetical protein GY778_12185 [bacterium]|nr:hypothetical protein [bacterium]